MSSCPSSLALDAALAGRLDDLGVAYKTARGDRPTCFLVDTETYGSQHLGVTRALGDYFMQARA